MDEVKPASVDECPECHRYKDLVDAARNLYKRSAIRISIEEQPRGLVLVATAPSALEERLLNMSVDAFGTHLGIARTESIDPALGEPKANVGLMDQAQVDALLAKTIGLVPTSILEVLEIIDNFRTIDATLRAGSPTPRAWTGA